jgi:hypothetical protein
MVVSVEGDGRAGCLAHADQRRRPPPRDQINKSTKSPNGASSCSSGTYIPHDRGSYLCTDM